MILENLALMVLWRMVIEKVVLMIARFCDILEASLKFAAMEEL